MSFTVSAGKYDRKNEVVRVPFTPPKDAVILGAKILDAKGKAFAVGQVARSGLASPPAPGPNSTSSCPS